MPTTTSTCTTDCEPFAHYGCPTAAQTARTERLGRHVAMHGITSSPNERTRTMSLQESRQQVREASNKIVGAHNTLQSHEHEIPKLIAEACKFADLGDGAAKARSAEAKKLWESFSQSIRDAAGQLKALDRVLTQAIADVEDATRRREAEARKLGI